MGRALLDVPHGSLTMYHRGCRCQDCRDAKAADVRRKRRMQGELHGGESASPPVVFPDCPGSIANYWVGCRCAGCDRAVSVHFAGTGRGMGCRGEAFR